MNKLTLMRTVALSATLLAALACSPGEEAEVDSADVSTAGTATATETAGMTDTAATSTAAVDEPVKVTLIDYEIRMPDSLEGGPTSFQISNEGSHEHTFVISGNGVEQKLDQPLKPLEVATLEVDLQPGTYQVLCTYDDHDDEHNMKKQITVTAPAAPAA